MVIPIETMQTAINGHRERARVDYIEKSRCCLLMILCALVAWFRLLF